MWWDENIKNFTNNSRIAYIYKSNIPNIYKRQFWNAYIKYCFIVDELYKLQANEMKIISLGWGIQSTTLAVMSALGDIEPVDYAIHSDTTHEAQGTYDYATRWTDWLNDRGVKVVTVKPETAPMIDKWGGVTIPAHGQGLINRQCTGHWKIAPMRRMIQKLRNGEPVDQWLGISLDEVQRWIAERNYGGVR